MTRGQSLAVRSCREYDLIYDEVPRDLDSILAARIAAAILAGADLAWFGFEGSFDFEHILTPMSLINCSASGPAR